MLYLFPHSQVVSADLLDFYRRVQPRLGKSMVHDLPFWQGVKHDCPKTKFIGRLFDSWNTHQIEDPKIAGKSWAGRQYVIPCFRLVYDYPEYLNEVFGYTTTDQAALHARWEWMDIAQEAFYDRWKELDSAKEPIAGNCGTGNMSGDEWVKYLPRTVKKYRLFGFHGYGYPTISADAKYQALRYREIMAKIRTINPQARGILTECGITHMVIPGNPDIGYTDIMTPDEYWCGAGNLSWLNDRLIEDKDFMEGGAVFQFEGEPEHWSTFECIRTSIVDFMAAISPGTPAVDLGGGVMPTYSYAFGFLDRYKKNPTEVGEPLCNQYYVVNDDTNHHYVVEQVTANGLLRWESVSNAIQFFRAA